MPADNAASKILLSDIEEHLGASRAELDMLLDRKMIREASGNTMLYVNGPGVSSEDISGALLSFGAPAPKPSAGRKA